MQQFPFNPKLATGNPKVDEQHKKLFELISDFFATLGTGKPHENSIRTLKELVEYAKRHFVDEEALMRATAYPQMAQHITLHNELASKTGTLLQQYKKGDLTLSIDVANFLNDWLVNHILDHDLAMIQWIQQNRDKDV